MKGFISFVPFQLEIEGRPELSDFPQNVIVEGEEYIPNLETFDEYMNMRRMRYFVQDSPIHWLEIRFDVEKKDYSAEICVGHRPVLQASGPDWKTFFTHLTMSFDIDQLEEN